MKITIDTEKLHKKFLLCAVEYDQSHGVLLSSGIHRGNMAAANPVGLRSLKDELPDTMCIAVIVPIYVPRDTPTETHRSVTEKDFK